MAGIATTPVHLGDVTGMQQAVVTSFNQLARLQVSTSKHYAQSEGSLTFADLSGSDSAAQAAAVAAANEWMVKYLAHIADTIAHIAADASPPSLTIATDVASAVTLANAIKADYNTHIGDTGQHPNADATNTIASSDATNLATLQTLLNEAKNTTGFNQHVASAPTVSSLRIVNL